MIDEILPKLDDSNYQHAVALAKLPNSIRGFGPVKLKSVEKAEVNKKDLLGAFHGAGAIADATNAKKVEPAE